MRSGEIFGTSGKAEGISLLPRSHDPVPQAARLERSLDSVHHIARTIPCHISRIRPLEMTNIPKSVPASAPPATHSTIAPAYKHHYTVQLRRPFEVLPAPQGAMEVSRSGNSGHASRAPRVSSQPLLLTGIRQSEMGGGFFRLCPSGYSAPPVSPVLARF